MYLFCFYSTLDLSELGHSCKLSCELSARVKPTLSDVKVALIDMGMYVYSIFVHVQGGRRGGLMVSALNSRASGPGSRPSLGCCVVLCCVYTQVYKWVPVNLMLGVTPQWTSIVCVCVCIYPIQGGVEILSVTSCC